MTNESGGRAGRAISKAKPAIPASPMTSDQTRSGIAERLLERLLLTVSLTNAHALMDQACMCHLADRLDGGRAD